MTDTPRKKFTGLDKNERDFFGNQLLALIFKYSKQADDYSQEVDPYGELDVNELLDTILKRLNGEGLIDSALIESLSLTPKQIKSNVDEYIVGQDEAKKALSVVFFNHLRRISAYDAAVSLGTEKDFSLGKSSAIMVGPTGTGKTYIVEQISKIFDLPVYIADATTITQSGFVGKSATDLIEHLFIASGKDANKTERGIIFIDEIDKLASNKSGKQNSMLESSQQSLLKLIEGCDVEVDTGEKGHGVPKVTINTKNILFILGGAFVGMIDNKETTKTISYIDTPIEDTGFVKQNERVMPKHLIKYGLIPELVGRISLITKLHHLNESHLIQILKESKNNAIEQYRNMFFSDNIDVVFPEETYAEIAKVAVSLKTGARSLRSIIDFLMVDKIYDIELDGEDATKEIIVDLEYTKDKLENYTSVESRITPNMSIIKGLESER